MKKPPSKIIVFPRVVTLKEARAGRKRARGSKRMLAPIPLDGLPDMDALRDVSPCRLGKFVLSIYHLSFGHDLAGAFAGTDRAAMCAVRAAAAVAGLAGFPIGLLLRLCIPAAVFFPFDRERAELAAAVKQSPAWRSGYPPAVSIVQASLQARRGTAEKQREAAAAQRETMREKRKERTIARRKSKALTAKRNAHRADAREAVRASRYYSRLMRLATGITLPIPGIARAKQ